MATEASGGGTPDLGFFLEVLGYIRGVGVGDKSGGTRGGHEAERLACPPGRAPHPRGPLVTPLTDFFRLKTSGNRIDQEFRRRKPL